MQKAAPSKKVRKAQHQRRPGIEKKMQPRPVFDHPHIPGHERLKNKVALITGGDSGIGKAVSILFAKEGADVAIAYLNENADAKETRGIIEKTYGKRCLLLPGDLSKEAHCIRVVERTFRKFGKLDIVVNNAALHYENKSLEELTTSELLRTFSTNIFSYFWITKAALKYLGEGSSIINTSSVTAYRGSSHLIDYAATKGAIVSFTRSLSANLADRGIRVNGVAPGPVWTPLIPATFKGKKVQEFGTDVPLHRAAEPVEVAPCYLFLATEDSGYITGQFLHPNGGEVVNG
ncbi:MAG TPA: SDR family oxidoreductase [Chitinophagaceae bacterium]|nr:SDR family oxidoreductase [Chitinophagaceae bacterium]